jgi:hypothetical protein
LRISGPDVHRLDDMAQRVAGLRDRRSGWLSPDEAAVVLQLRRREVVNRLRRGELRIVPRGRLRGADAVELAEIVGESRLALFVLDAILDRRLVVRALDLDSQPLSLIESWDAVR